MRIKLGRCLLDDCLKAAGMDRKDLEESIGYSRQRIWDYASREKVMSVEALFTISNAIGCKPTALYEREKVRNPEKVQKRQAKKTEL